MALSDYLTSDEWDACFYAAESGRNFLKKHCPELVGETDEQWEIDKKAAIDEQS